MIYLCPVVDVSNNAPPLPDGTEFRWLSTRSDLFKDCWVFETKVVVTGFQTPVDLAPLGDTTRCIEQFIRHKLDKSKNDKVEALFNALMSSEKIRNRKQLSDDIAAMKNKILAETGGVL